MPVDVHKVRQSYLVGAGPGETLGRLAGHATTFVAAVRHYRPDSEMIRSLGQRVIVMLRRPGGQADPVIDAMAFLASTAGAETDAELDVDRLVKRARAAAHPDRNNGDVGLWRQVEQARAVVQETR